VGGKPKGGDKKWAVKLTRARVQRTVSLSGRRGNRNDVTKIGVGGKAKEGEVQWAINHRGERAVGLKAIVGESGVVVNLSVARVRWAVNAVGDRYNL